MIYPKRYEFEPRKRKAYCVACDMIGVYGIERCRFPYKELGLCKTEMKEVWRTAEADLNGVTNVNYIYRKEKRRGTYHATQRSEKVFA